MACLPLRFRVLRRCIGAALVAAGAAQAASSDAYQLMPLADQESPAAMRGCLGPHVDPQALRQFMRQALDQADLSAAAQFSGEQSPGVALAAGGLWTCVPLSPQGYPLWPVEAMHGLIVPVGVPADVTARWRRAMLDQVALDGVGRGLIVYPSGDADQLLVIAEQRQALHVKFSRRLLRAGEYREDSYPAVLRHPGLTRLVTRSTGPGEGTPKRLAIPPQRLMKPVRDGYVVIDPSPPTGMFVFAGTQWVAPGTDLRIDLKPGGLATRTSDGTLDPGTWRVDDGVLRVALASGVRYALALQGDRLTLAGMARRAEADSHDDEGDEWQWSTRLRMKGAADDGAAASSRSAAALAPLPGGHGPG